MREKYFRGRTYLIKTAETFEIFQSVMMSSRKKKKVEENFLREMNSFPRVSFLKLFPQGRKKSFTTKPINQSINPST
jgi:hypothetical protein